MAMRFCGEDIGDAAPPMFEANAIPIISALDIFESDGKFRRMGWDVTISHENKSLPEKSLPEQ